MATEYVLDILVNPISNPSAASAMGAKDGESYAQGFNKNFSKQQPLGRITGNVTEFQKSMDAANARVIAFGASAGSIYFVKVALDKLVSSTVQVEKALTNINVILGLGQTSLKAFSNEMFKAASQTGQTFETASQVALEFARHGVSATETVKRMTSAMELMRISGLSAEESVNSITAAINAFNREGLTSEDIVNRLTAVDTKFAVSAQDLAKSIERVGATAQDAGVRFNELLGFVAAAQTTTARGGAVIGNAFKSIFTRLARPEVLEDLESVGVTTKNAAGQILPMVSILKNLAAQYDHLSYSQRSFISEAVGGVYQVNILKASLADLGNGLSIFDKASIAASQSTGLIDKRMASLNETLSSKINVSILEITKLFANFGQISFGDAAKDGLDAFNDSLSSISDKLEDIKPDDSIGEKLGKTLGQGISKGIGDILSGPGIQIVAALATKALTTLGKQGFNYGREFLGKNENAEKIKFIQQDITKFVRENADAQAIVNSGIDVAVRLSEAYLKNVSATAAAIEKMSGFTYGAASVAAINVKASPAPHVASGYVPSFSANQETSQARSLGASAGVQAQWGKGTIGGRSFIMNNQEVEIPNFGLNGDSAVIPTYAGGNLTFKKSYDKEFGITKYTGFLGEENVGDIEHGPTREVEYFGINKKYQGQGFAKQFYGAMGPGDVKGTILPNYNKDGSAFFPQLSRARIAKEAHIVENFRKKLSISQFEGLVEEHKKDKDYWFNNTFHLMTSHANGFVPNFALDQVFSLLPSRMTANKKGSYSEMGAAYEMDLMKKLPSLGFSDIKHLSAKINPNMRADFYAKYQGSPWLLDAKHSPSAEESKISSLSYKESSMRILLNEIKNNPEAFQYLDANISNEVDKMKLGVILSNPPLSTRLKGYNKAGISYQKLSNGFIPNFSIGGDRFDQISKFLSGSVKKPTETLSQNDLNDAIHYLEQLNSSQLDNDIKNGGFGGAFPFGRRKTSSIAVLLKKKGFSFSAVQDAINREIGAGYSPSQVKVGEDSSLISSSNPRGIGVYNSTEGSLDTGIKLAKGAGIDPSTKGLAGGYVPNFADVGVSLMLGVLQGSITDLTSKLNFLSVGYSKEIEQRRSLAEEYSKAISEIKSKGSTITPLGQFSSEDDLKNSYFKKYSTQNRVKGRFAPGRTVTQPYLFDEAAAKQENTNYDIYTQDKDKSQQKLSKVGLLGETIGPLIGETIASSLKNSGSENLAKGFQELSGGLTTASQLLQLFPNKLGQALALGEVFKSAANAVSSYIYKTGTLEKQLDIQSTTLEKMTSSANTVLDSFDKLSEIYSSSASTMQDFFVQQNRLTKALSDLSSVAGGQQLAENLRNAGSDQQRRTAVAQAVDASSNVKNIDEVKLAIAQSKQSSSFLSSSSNPFYYSNDADKIGKTQLLKTASSTMESNALENLKDKDLNQRRIQGTLNDGDVNRIKLAAEEGVFNPKANKMEGGNILGLDGNALKTALSELEYQLNQVKIPKAPDNFKGDWEQAYKQHTEELKESAQEEITLRNKYNQELQNLLNKGAITSSFNLKSGAQSEESRFRGESFGLYQQSKQLQLRSLTTNDYGMIGLNASQQQQDIISKNRHEQNINVNKGATEVNSAISSALGKVIEAKQKESTQDTSEVATKSQLAMSKFIADKQSQYSSNPQALLNIAKDPENFVANFLGTPKEAPAKGLTNEKDYNKLSNELSTAVRSPDFNSKITDILLNGNEIAQKSQEELNKLHTDTINALKEASFKELASALGGPDLLKRGGAREERRKIRRDEYIVAHGTNPIERGEAAHELLQTKLPSQRDINDPLYGVVQSGFAAAIKFVLDGTKMGQNFDINETAKAQTYGDKTIAPFNGKKLDAGNPSIPGVDVSALDDSVAKAADDLYIFSDAIASMGSKARSFLDEVNKLGQDNANKKAQYQNTPIGTEPAGNQPQQGFLHRHSDAIWQTAGTLGTGLISGATQAIGTKILTNGIKPTISAGIKALPEIIPGAAAAVGSAIGATSAAASTSASAIGAGAGYIAAGTGASTLAGITAPIALAGYLGYKSHQITKDRAMGGQSALRLRESENDAYVRNGSNWTDLKDTNYQISRDRTALGNINPSLGQDHISSLIQKLQEDIQRLEQKKDDILSGKKDKTMSDSDSAPLAEQTIKIENGNLMITLDLSKATQQFQQMINTSIAGIGKNNPPKVSIT